MTGVAGGLISLEYALAGLQYTGTQPARDADITKYIQAATPVIESLAGPVLPQTVTRRRDGGKSAVLLSGVRADNVVTAVRADGAAWSGYVVDTDSGIVYAGSGRTFPPGVRNVEVDITVGYTDIPQALQLATRELVRHWVQLGKQSPGPSAVAFPQDTAAVIGDEYAIPRRVRQLCAPFAGGGFA